MKENQRVQENFVQCRAHTYVIIACKKRSFRGRCRSFLRIINYHQRRMNASEPAIALWRSTHKHIPARYRSPKTTINPSRVTPPTALLLGPYLSFANYRL